MAKRGNPAKPGVAITLDKPRRVLFDLNALAALEEQTGKNMLSAEGWAQFQQFDDKGEPLPITATAARLVLWAGLLHEDPELTVQDVGKLIREDNLAAIETVIAAATTASLPEPEPDRPLAKTERRRRRGSNSGATGATTSA